jgi:PP-loop superfamily ATP-utilizing enzyme
MTEDLLQTTRRLMDGPRDRRLAANGPSIPQHLIAFSGGIDSSLVAALVQASHVRGGAEEVRAVLGLSPAVPTEQVDLAVRMAAHLNVALEMVATNEGEDDVYLANAGQACLACKTHLYSTLAAIVQHGQQQHQQHDAGAFPKEGGHDDQRPPRFQLYNGTNADDLTDPTRLGLVAARDFSVQSPLAAVPKTTVRRVARHLGLPNWNYAASPCLRSRLALGVSATSAHLELMAAAERLVRQTLADYVDESTNLRVRLLAGHRARIEVDAALVAAAAAVDWTSLQALGSFRAVTVQAFSSGSVSLPLAAAVDDDEEEDPVVMGTRVTGFA